MLDICVFCGQPTDGRLVCPACEHHLEDLSPEQREYLRDIERENEARERFQLACRNFRVAVCSLLDSITAVIRQFDDVARRGGKR